MPSAFSGFLLALLQSLIDWLFCYHGLHPWLIAHAPLGLKTYQNFIPLELEGRINGKSLNT